MNAAISTSRRGTRIASSAAQHRREGGGGAQQHGAHGADDRLDRHRAEHLEALLVHGQRAERPGLAAVAHEGQEQRAEQHQRQHEARAPEHVAGRDARRQRHRHQHRRADGVDGPVGERRGHGHERDRHQPEDLGPRVEPVDRAGGIAGQPGQLERVVTEGAHAGAAGPRRPVRSRGRTRRAFPRSPRAPWPRARSPRPGRRSRESASPPGSPASLPSSRNALSSATFSSPSGLAEANGDTAVARPTASARARITKTRVDFVRHLRSPLPPAAPPACRPRSAPPVRAPPGRAVRPARPPPQPR